MLEAMIFDFDGLIIETEVPDFQSWQEIYQQYGATLSLATWLPLIGTGSATRTFHPHTHLEAQIGHSLDRDEIRVKRRQRYTELVAAQPLRPGVKALINAGKKHGLRLAVSSSSAREWVIGHLMHRGLAAHFEHIMCGDDVAQAKPSPDVYLAVLAKLGLQAREVIALEDSPNGVRAAKQAGIFCVAIPNPLTQQLPFDDADMRLTSLADLSLEHLCEHPSFQTQN